MDTLRCIGNGPRAAHDEEGQTLVEYGLLVTLLAMAVVLVLTLVGQDVEALFTSVSSKFEDISSP